MSDIEVTEMDITAWDMISCCSDVEGPMTVAALRIQSTAAKGARIAELERALGRIAGYHDDTVLRSKHMEAIARQALELVTGKSRDYKPIADGDVREMVERLTGARSLEQHEEDRAQAAQMLERLQAEIEGQGKALKACRAWHYAEQNYLGSFNQRSDLCAYSEYLTQKSLGLAVGDHTPLPVLFGEGNGAAQIDTWIAELLEHEAKSLPTPPTQGN